MSTLSLAIIIVFVAGYLFIALESVTKVNKAAVALLMFVVVWTLYMLNPGYFVSLMHPQFLDILKLEHPELGSHVDPVLIFVTDIIQGHLGDTGTTLFFLMGAMTIVEVVDQNGGFDWVRRVMHTKSKRTLLWRIAFMTFFLSAILDNMTTSIVMIMILRKLVPQHKDRIIYAALVIIAANSGGAFSPIGDVTTIMLWNKGLITAAGVIGEIFVPSLISMIIPALILQMALKGNLDDGTEPAVVTQAPAQELGDFQRKVVFWIGVGGLMFVPVFKSITHLPPFVGILLVLSVLWIVTEVFYAKLQSEKDTRKKRVINLIRNIDMSTILFFLGILMAVSCLEEIGALSAVGKGLNVTFNGNHFMVTGIIGVLSSIIDNVPLVAGCMGMYPIQAVGDFAADGIFWQLLAYCAGVGGSLLIIGSAAGVVVMGLEKITFGWYMKHVSWIAFVGYLAGILSYYVIREFIFTIPL
ncbi:sodium:proton antiporter NhaD [Hallella multisaccharivorax]|uniref:sodium:proton antiporter NhaD n=1 Tax=Hallella multisaccharivorax TaxID=310514 RepID=UPI0036135A9A